jgi:hypothetical protein
VTPAQSRHRTPHINTMTSLSFSSLQQLSHLRSASSALATEQGFGSLDAAEWRCVYHTLRSLMGPEPHFDALRGALEAFRRSSVHDLAAATDASVEDVGGVGVLRQARPDFEGPASCPVRGWVWTRIDHERDLAFIRARDEQEVL